MLYNFKSSSQSHTTYGSKVTWMTVFRSFHNERVEAYTICMIYPRMYIYYPIPISLLMCCNWSEYL